MSEWKYRIIREKKKGGYYMYTVVEVWYQDDGAIKLVPVSMIPIAKQSADHLRAEIDVIANDVWSGKVLEEVGGELREVEE